MHNSQFINDIFFQKVCILCFLSIVILSEIYFFPFVYNITHRTVKRYNTLIGSIIWLFQILCSVSKRRRLENHDVKNRRLPSPSV